ncbi:MAG: hypothetical protein J0I12_14550 [Candidatus Eremiobacteraeota bacterium]|nr:hypothetical protein [Candidatus Eremiobacteraeota bacterium]
MMVIAMLMAVVLAISHFQAVARQTYMTEEASLRFREGARFAVQQQLINYPPPSGLLVTATSANVTKEGNPVITKLMAQNIFDRKNGLPDLRSLDSSPANNVLKLTPTTSDVGLRVFGSNSYTAVITNVPGYAAYAPNGSVNITNMESWANPTYQDTRKSLEAYSGVMAVVGAKKDATVSNVTYGEAHVIEGNAKIDHGNGITYKREKYLPFPAYEGALFEQITQARTELMTSASFGDKTSQIYSGGLTPGSIIKLFFGGEQGLEQFLSLSNANHFFLPTIPFFSPAPPYLYSFAFHMPYPADTANYETNEQLAGQIQTLNEKLKKAGEELELLWKAVEAAQTAYNQNNSLENLTALNNAKTAHDTKQNEVDSLNQQMQALFGPQKAEMDAKIASSQPRGVPLTRSQDPDGNDGVTGWSYASAGGMLGKLIGLLFTFDFEDLASQFGNPDVKLVHFGSKDREFKFILSGSTMGIDATMTVPRGRTLKLSSPNITISGDLWLQRGSTFYADCDKLSIVPGRGSDPSKFFSPAGRIFLEEGATLICRGEVECVGSPQWGSVVVGGVPGKIHPITTAILARKVNLGNGVFAGCAIDDLAEGLGDMLDSNQLKDLNNHLLRPLLANIAPNAAKAFGPFFARKPYFAKYATTFQIICPPLPPFGQPGPPIPTPIPFPIKNCMVPVARAFGFVYSVSLNLGLGENFYTHSDWWIFGEGVVPMVPQADPTKLAQKFTSFGTNTLAALDPAEIIGKFIESAAKDMVAYVVTEVCKQIVTKIASAAIPYVGLTDIAGTLLDEITQNLSNRFGAQATAGDAMTSALTSSVANAGKATLDNIAGMISLNLQDEFLREYNGTLVYAEETITVGGKNATGMFVAGGDIQINASQCVGTLLSKGGNVACSRLLFYPYFNQASLYVPKEGPSGWLSRGKEFLYDKDYASNKAVDIGPPTIPPVVSAQGWAQ